MTEIDYEKLWGEIEELARKEFSVPPPYAKSIKELAEEFDLTHRHEIRNFINRLVKEEKIKLWGNYKNRNYYVPFIKE